jgi:hypothetical protein
MVRLNELQSWFIVQHLNRHSEIGDASQPTQADADLDAAPVGTKGDGIVVAGRPDGLAITVSAIIIAGAAVIYRCSVGVKSYVSSKPKKPQADAGEVDRDFIAPTPVESPIVARSRSRSWLRDGD